MVAKKEEMQGEGGYMKNLVVESNREQFLQVIPLSG